ncbi:MAG: tRNA (adenosine(37)-N6)-threonylcarbamoyltransferase complex dimerization subunit type 1 TsaB [Hyphomicrobiaceae bacterium]
MSGRSLQVKAQMRILALDTALAYLSVACLEAGPSGDALLVQERVGASGAHAERLMPLIQEVLDRAHLAFADIDRLAVTLGPGTFTGVRTGIAAARGFRLACGVEVVGTTSLAVMAEQAFREIGGELGGRALLVTSDARRGRIYAELFGTGSSDPLSGPAELGAPDIQAFCQGRPVLAVGSGIAVPDIRAALDQSGCVVRDDLAQIVPMAEDLARMAKHLAPLDVIVPLYIRPPDAKPPTSHAIARQS